MNINQSILTVPQHQLVEVALQLWDLPNYASARMINISENATYLVEAGNGFKSIIRLHRENYHTENAIESELAWTKALNSEGGVVTPDIINGRNGKAIQKIVEAETSNVRLIVMFEFVDGVEPDENEDLILPFEGLGEIAAKTHQHSMNWEKPNNFERMSWNLDTVFGDDPTWGSWHDGPNVDKDIHSVLEETEALLKKRLLAFGQSKDRYGLIHADMRLANLLINDGETRLIDFDDCGFGWYLYDFATGISFMETNPVVPKLKEAWVKGYQKIRPLSEAEIFEIDSFVMFRRMALLAWIGSHSEVEVAQELAPDFAKGTAEIAKEYLKTHR